MTSRGDKLGFGVWWRLLHAVVLGLCFVPDGGGATGPSDPQTVSSLAGLVSEPAKSHQWPSGFVKPVPSSIEELQLMENHVKTLLDRVQGAVVAVEQGNGTGSGVVISTDGLVLTAGHVVSVSGRSVRFRFPDGRTARGRVLGIDEQSDAGLVQIMDKGPWPFVPVAEQSAVKAGEWVLAMGHPGGFDSKRSVVVRLGRVLRSSSDSVQTDCTITLGDSGGPLLDMAGRVVGIHSAITGSMSGNFHIPMAEFYAHWKTLAGDARTVPSIARGYLGAAGKDVAGGCLISSVEKGSPAFQAGLQVGDVVTGIDGRLVKVAATLDRWVQEAGPGQTLELAVRRSGQSLKLRVIIAPSPGPEKSAQTSRRE